MNRIIFNNPPKDLFFKLKRIGLVDFHHALSPSEHLKGKSIYDIKIDGISENATWGNYKDIKLIKKGGDECNDKYIKDNKWISATIDLTSEGIRILKSSGLTDWEIQN